MDKMRNTEEEERGWESPEVLERKSDNSDTNSSQVKLTNTGSGHTVRERILRKLERTSSLDDKANKKSESHGKKSWMRSLRSVKSHCDEDESLAEGQALGGDRSKSADCLRDAGLAEGQGDDRLRDRAMSDTWLARFGRSNVFRRSQKASSQAVEEKMSLWRRITSCPRACWVEVVDVFRTFLQVVSMFLIASWQRLDKGLQDIGAVVMNACRHALSLCVDLTPRKVLKSLMIRACLLLPDLRNRRAVVRCLQAAPSSLTKRAVSWYTKNVSLSTMWWHTLVSLKDSSVKSFLLNLDCLLGVPRRLLQMLVLAVSAALEILARGLKCASGGKNDVGDKTNSSRISWKLKKAKCHAEDENVKDKTT